MEKEIAIAIDKKLANDSVLTLRIIYEDEALLIVDKPAGLLVHPTVKNEQETLCSAVAAYYRSQKFTYTIHPVSRLDRFTSGLVLFAKAPFVQFELSQRQIDKEYLALVIGRLPQTQGSIIAPIARKKNSIIERCVSDTGKYARTDYKVVTVCGKLTLVRLHLMTGRTHQLRVHMAHIGCPILGDHLYGEAGEQSRHYLHAARLSFVHPLTETQLTVTATLPEDMQNLVTFNKAYAK